MLGKCLYAFRVIFQVLLKLTPWTGKTLGQMCNPGPKRSISLSPPGLLDGKRKRGEDLIFVSSIPGKGGKSHELSLSLFSGGVGTILFCWAETDGDLTNRKGRKKYFFESLNCKIRCLVNFSVLRRSPKSHHLL